MSCYHPLFGFYEGEKFPSGAKRYRITACPDDPVEAMKIWPGSVIIPCGKCIGCKIQYSRNWADRMLLELIACGKGIFVTLTYANNDPNVPIVEDENGEVKGLTLRKKDVSEFMKRLRSRQRFEDKTIRFFAAGEYGPKTGRPHYHAILFGLSLEDFPDRKELGRNELNQKYFVSNEFTEIWTHGYTLMSEVSWNTCAYVARYCMKKIGSELQDIDPNFEREFTLMSRRPGIGKPYMDLHPEKIDHDHIYEGKGREENEIPIPRYFLNQLKNSKKLTDREKFDKIMENRRKTASNNMMLKLRDTQLGYLEMLEMEEQKFMSTIKPLKRNKIE